MGTSIAQGNAKSEVVLQEHLAPKFTGGIVNIANAKYICRHGQELYIFSSALANKIGALIMD